MKAKSIIGMLAIMVVVLVSQEAKSQNFFFKIGDNLSKGAGKNVDTIGHHLVGSIRDELTTPQSQQAIGNTLDSILKPTLISVCKMAGDVLDSVRWNVQLITDSARESLTGIAMQQNLTEIQSKVVGKSKQDVFQVLDRVQLLLNGVLSDSTKVRVGALRDELLGPKTNEAITHIIDTAVSHLVDSSMNRLAFRLKNDINPIITEDVSHVRRNLIIVIVAIGLISIIIIVLVWQRKSRYLKMVTLLTKQIHDIPDQQMYDTMTKRIKSEATNMGLEPSLRAILNENGLINSDAWKKT